MKAVVPKAPFSAAAAPAVSFSVTPESAIDRLPGSTFRPVRSSVKSSARSPLFWPTPTMPLREGVSSMSMKKRVR